MLPPSMIPEVVKRYKSAQYRRKVMEMNGLGGMPIGASIGSSSSPPTTGSANAKKKRRTNANTAQVTQRATNLQDFVPPPLSGFGDTVVASNPFDDTPPMTMNPAMHNGPHQMHPHHMGNSQMRGINPLTGNNMNPMMPHMGNVSSMNSGIGNHMGHMGNMSNANHSPMNNMAPMNNMRPNMPQGNMGPMNSHMNINHMMNSPITGPGMNSPINGMNHNLGSPMGGPIGSPINNISPNHMASSNLNVNAMNATNTALSHTAPPPHQNPLNNIRGAMNRPHNMPMANMGSAVPPMLGNNQMPNMNMMRSQMGNMPNVNMNQRNQLGHMGNPMANVTNNLSGKSPSHGMNIANAIPQHGIQGPPMGPKPIPEPTGKVYPPDQPMVFNHQNPNAPPISPCGICHKEVHANDQAIFCESGCNFWHHRRCTGLTEVAYELMMQEVCAEWVCDRCMQSKQVALVKYKP